MAEDVQVTVDFPGVFTQVDRNSNFIPGHLTGAVRQRGENADPNEAVPLGVAVNGVLAGITRPYDFPVAGRRNAWEVVIDTQLVRDGANTVEVFTIDATGDGPAMLARAYTSEIGGLETNLIREEAAVLWGVRSSGFYPTEWAGEQPFRWTGERVSLIVPVDQDAPPSELVVKVLMTGSSTKHVRVFLNELYVVRRRVPRTVGQGVPLVRMPARLRYSRDPARNRRPQAQQ